MIEPLFQTMTRLRTLFLALTIAATSVAVPRLPMRRTMRPHRPRLPPSQEHATPAAEHATPAEVDIITPHISDSYDIELPYWKPPFAKHVCLGRHECRPHGAACSGIRCTSAACSGRRPNTWSCCSSRPRWRP